MDITKKQQRFVDEYMIDLNATQAAIRAGYSAKTAKEQAARLLSKVNIQTAIAHAQKKVRKRSAITLDRVLAEYRAIAFANINDYLSYSPAGVVLLDSKSIKRRAASAVAEVSESIGQFGTAVKFKLHNKIAALDAICRILGFGTDKDDNENKAEQMKEAVKAIAAALLRDTVPAQKVEP